MKQILFIALALMMAVAASAQPSMPVPVSIYVEFNGVAVEGVNIGVTNLRTGEFLGSGTVDSLKTEKGKAAFDLGNFKQGYYVKDPRGLPGDSVEIKVCSVAPECVQTYEIVDRTVRTFSFYVNSPEAVAPVAPPPPPVYVCPDGSQVSDASSCPVTVQPEPEAEPEPEPVPDVSDSIFEELMIAVAGILGALGVQFKRGILKIARYHWTNGRKMQALKTLLTLAKNAKEGVYTSDKLSKRQIYGLNAAQQVELLKQLGSEDFPKKEPGRVELIYKLQK